MGLHMTGSSLTQLNNALVPKWQPSTAYTAGQIVMSPDGSIVKRLADGTSGSSYTSANWQTVATVAGTQANTELDAEIAARAVSASLASGANLQVGYSGNSIAGGIANTLLGGNTATNENKMLGSNNYRTIMGGYDQQIGAGIACGSIASQHARVLNPGDPTNPDGAVSPNHSYAIAGSYHVITAGAYNTALGGTANTISSTQGGTAVGGQSHTVSGTNASALGGSTNVAGGAGATALGGSGSSAYGAGSIVAGVNLIAGANGTTRGDGVALLGGRDSTFGGTSSARYSGALGGRDHSCDVEYAATIGGRAAKPLFPGAVARAMNSFATTGDAQAMDLTLHNTTTDGTATLLYADGTTAGALTLPANTLWSFKLLVSAYRTDVVGECATWEVTGSIYRGASGASTRLVGAPVVTAMKDAAAAAWDLSAAASTGTTGKLSVTATGEAAKTIHWVADLKIVQVQ